jgi:PilZ domain
VLLIRKRKEQAFMHERRQLRRQRVYYGGVVAFNDRNSTIACIVRNFSRFGAKIELGSAALLPDQVDFTVERKGLSCVARLVWRDRDEVGLAFEESTGTSDVIPLEWARKLSESKRLNRQLQARLDQLRFER